MEKRMCYKVLLGSIVFAALLLFGLPVGSAGVVRAADYTSLTPVDSGEANTSYWDDVKWAVYDCDGDNSVDTLVFSGKGEIIPDLYKAKWGKYKSYDLTLVIEEGITSIAALTFQGMNLIGDITLPKSLKEIGMNAFQNCTKLDGTVTFASPSSLTEIGTYAFDGCNQLSGIVLPDSLTSIGYYAFRNCSSLTGTVTIPKKIKTIEVSTFSGCTSIKGVNLGDVTSINGSAFWGCTGLTGTLKLPDGLNEIGNSAFKGCSNLTGTLKIPAGVTNIPVSCFENTGFSAVEFPADLKTIGAYAFQDCSNLTGTLKIPAGVTTITQYCFKNTGITSVELPQGLKSIGQWAFYNGKLQSDIVIPEGVTDIGESAFSGCTPMKDKAIIIPYSITNVGKDAFKKTNAVIYNLSDVEISGSSNSIYTISKKYKNGITIRKALPKGVHDELTQYHSFPVAQYDDADIWYSDEACTNSIVGTVEVTSDVTYYSSEMKSLNQAEVTIAEGKNAITKTYGEAPFQLDGISYTGDGALVYTVKSGADVISVSADGKVTILKSGSATIGITTTETSTYSPAEEKLISITILECTHIWDDGRVTTEATSDKDGVKTYTCTVCKATKTEVIPKTGANPGKEDDKPNQSVKPKVGDILTDPVTKAKYKVTSISADGTAGTVKYIKPTVKKIKKVNIPSSVKLNGITYKVTSIAAKAFKGQKKLTKVTIGSNVTSIGAKAFSGCKNLKNITIKTKKLTKKNVGKQAFKGISAKAKIKVPKSKKKDYNTLLKKRGVSSKAKIV